MKAPKPRPDPQKLRDLVRRVIYEVLQRKKSKASLEDVTEGASLTRDLGIDSLDILQITAKVEKTYQLRLPEEELKRLDDLRGIVAAVSRHWPAA